MILCEWDAPEGDPGQSCVHLFAHILSTSPSSVSIFSVCCYSIVSISMKCTEERGGGVRCAQTGHPLKLPSPTKLARLGHFPAANQAGRLAGPVFYVYVFSLVEQTAVIVSLDSRMTGLSRALRVFEDTDLHLVHIESRRHKVSKVMGD